MSQPDLWLLSTVLLVAPELWVCLSECRYLPERRELRGHRNYLGETPLITTQRGSYLYGCSPVCVLRCLVRFADLGKILPQYLRPREEK